MNLTYLKRNYLFNKAADKVDINRNHIFILYSIYILQPVKWFDVVKKMHQVKRGRDKVLLTQHIRAMVAKGLIARDPNRLYSLTNTGLSTLKDIENKLRKERHDK